MALSISLLVAMFNVFSFELRCGTGSSAVTFAFVLFRIDAYNTLVVAVAMMILLVLRTPATGRASGRRREGTQALKHTYKPHTGQ